MGELETIYRETLARCTPENLVRNFIEPSLPKTVVAIGKAGGPLLDGVLERLEVGDSLVIVPHGYPPPRATTQLLNGGHPHMNDASFDAGETLLRFVNDHEDILFLISGGGSACVEVPLSPWFTRADLITTNARLIDAGLPITDINCVRKHLSAIKGGRLGAHVRGRAVTFIYSDVSADDFVDVASGPTTPDGTTKNDAINILDRIGGCDRIVTSLRDQSLPETVHHLDNATAVLVGSNASLTTVASVVAQIHGLEPVMWDGEIEGDVEVAALALLARAALLRPGQLLVAGGEPTVVKRGNGRGGRCTELAVRFALAATRGAAPPLQALFGSSDGVDGNSGLAAVLIDSTGRALDEGAAAAALRQSDSLQIVEQVGRAVIMRPTGNNLRDLYLVARA